jgi:hypothetical protein
MKSGKYTLGYKTVLKCLRSGKGASPRHRAPGVSRRLAAAAVACVKGIPCRRAQGSRV